MFLFLAVIKQFLSDVSWGDLDHQIVDTPSGMMTMMTVACDALMCKVQLP